MSIFDFLSQDELVDLPDDPQIAFAEFTRLAQNKLNERSSALNVEDEYQWRQLEGIKYDFVNIVIAASKRFEIEPFASMSVPTYQNFNQEYHQQFKADIDHYMTQLVLQNIARGRRESVPIAPKVKDRIYSHLSALKDCVDNADLTDAKKEKLLEKLKLFEKELEKSRLNLLAVAKVTFEIFALAGGVWQSGEIVTRLVTNILQEVGEAKAVEDETRSLPSEPVIVALSAPRVEVKSTNSFADDLDDEIPF